MTSLNASIKNYIQVRFDKRKDKEIKSHELAISKTDSIEVIKNLKESHELALKALTEDFKAANWLDKATKKAAQIKIATHTSSYPNSSANGANVIAKEFSQNEMYVDTNSLSTPTLDIAGNAAAFDIGSLLLLSDGDKTLLDFVLDDDISPFSGFYNSKEQAEEWIKNLALGADYTSLNSHVYSRQVYFPIGDNEYHLLAPLYPLSMSSQLHQMVNHSRFSKDMANARKARREKLPHDGSVISYPNIAAVQLGGSKPQNVSSLNAKRGGMNYLLPSTPPMVRETVLSLNTCIFQSYEFNRQVRPLTNRLVKAIIVSTKSKSVIPRVRNAMEKLIDEIIDSSFNHAHILANQPAGWLTDKTQVPFSQRIWLDKNNHLNEREDRSWIIEISEAFAIWLVMELNRLSGGAYTLGRTEIDMWTKAYRTAMETIV